MIRAKVKIAIALPYRNYYYYVRDGIRLSMITGVPYDGRVSIFRELSISLLIALDLCIQNNKIVRTVTTLQI